MKLFVNHCGHLGIIEAVWNSLPVVCMAISVDQFDNMFKIINKGIGLGLNKDTITPEAVYAAVQEVTTDPKYRNNAHKLSIQMRDVREGPLDRAISFLEYLMRHEGAPHLKQPQEKILFMEYFCLDIMIIIFLTSLVFILSIYTIISQCTRSKRS